MIGHLVRWRAVKRFVGPPSVIWSKLLLFYCSLMTDIHASRYEHNKVCHVQSMGWRQEIQGSPYKVIDGSLFLSHYCPPLTRRAAWEWTLLCFKKSCIPVMVRLHVPTRVYDLGDLMSPLAHLFITLLMGWSSCILGLSFHFVKESLRFLEENIQNTACVLIQVWNNVS